MEKVIEFVGNNYAWFLTISIILLFALIGYIVDSKRSKNDLLKKTETEIDENAIQEIMNNTENEGKSLSDMVSKSKNINPETKGVDLVDENILNKKDETNSTNQTATEPSNTSASTNTNDTNNVNKVQ